MVMKTARNINPNEEPFCYLHLFIYICNGAPCAKSYSSGLLLWIPFFRLGSFTGSQIQYFLNHGF